MIPDGIFQLYAYKSQFYLVARVIRTIPNQPGSIIDQPITNQQGGFFAERLRGRFLPLAPYHWPWRQLNAKLLEKKRFYPQLHRVFSHLHFAQLCTGIAQFWMDPNISVTSGFVYGFFKRSQWGRWICCDMFNTVEPESSGEEKQLQATGNWGNQAIGFRVSVLDFMKCSITPET